MIGKLNHVAIAVPSVDDAAELYRQTLATPDMISEKTALPDHGVYTIFINLPNTKIELIEPLGEDSTIRGFLEKNKRGGMHHICYEVEDINASVEKLKAEGATVLGEVKIGAHGLPVIFLHPKSFNGVLIELEEVKK